mmetsp:Transcript_53930/g.115162  ORF Transcript_53930/g.115162 Transcript_53930/m.115162 type:complete len:300 (+) Transcript_53930:143-1042(+)
MGQAGGSHPRDQPYPSDEEYYVSDDLDIQRRVSKEGSLTGQPMRPKRSSSSSSSGQGQGPFRGAEGSSSSDYNKDNDTLGASKQRRKSQQGRKPAGGSLRPESPTLEQLISGFVCPSEKQTGYEDHDTFDSAYDVVQGGAPHAGGNKYTITNDGDLRISPQVMEGALRLRASWEPGTVLEVYSSSNGSWLPGIVSQVNRDNLLMVRFMDLHGNLLAKNVARTDLQLAAFGSHVSDAPPGFKQSSSRSRPGAVAYLQPQTGFKAGSLDVAWRYFLEEKLAEPQNNPSLRPPSGSPYGGKY